MKKSTQPRAWAAIIAAVLLAGASAAVAQEPNWQATPTYTTTNLQSGFTPDPWTLKIDAGGSTAVSGSLGPNCTGYIHAGAPDVDLNYTPGDYSLYIRARSSADTTLVVYGPDRRWYCNDDQQGLDPVVTFNNPQGGNYNIWVGVHGSDNLEPATLEISEMNPGQ